MHLICVGPSQLSNQQGSPAVSSQPHAVSSWNQSQPRPQGTDLDILAADILPHVDGQEVEEIFAGIEREMTNREFTFLDGEIGNDVTNPPDQFAPSVSNPAASYQADQHPIGAFNQTASNQAYNYGPSHYQAVPGAGGYQQGAQNHLDGFPNSVVSGQLGFEQNNTFPRQGDIELDDFPRERRRPPSPRVDPLKQQQKWEEDEKLGAMATISPVLYANLEHVNLKQEYPGEARFFFVRHKRGYDFTSIIVHYFGETPMALHCTGSVTSLFFCSSCMGNNMQWVVNEAK